MKNLEELKEMKKALSIIINTHEKMKNSYFWKPGRSASQRRANEKKNYFCYNDSKNYCVYLCNDYKESCNHVYYKGIFRIDNELVTIRKVKLLYNAIDAIC